MSRRERHGFTMIEVLAAVILTSIVISIAVSFQINLGATTAAARERLRTQRHAIALLDRIARDLAGAYFIAAKTPAASRANPWIFVTRRHFTEEGNADAIKFVTRNYQSQDVDGHSSDLAVVAYYLNPVEDGEGYRLMRWRKAQVPQVYDSTFPDLDDPDADIIGENLSSFALSMIDSTGAVFPDWDSARKAGRDALPIGVTIEIQMLDPSRIRDPDAEEDEEDDFDDEGEATTYSKTVVLPLRPLDWTFLESEARAGAVTNLAGLLDQADEFDDDLDEDDDEDDDEDTEDPSGRRNRSDTGGFSNDGFNFEPGGDRNLNDWRDSR